MRLQLRPAGQPEFTRDHELRLAQSDAAIVMVGTATVQRRLVTAQQGAVQILGALALLFQVETERGCRMVRHDRGPFPASVSAYQTEKG